MMNYSAYAPLAKLRKALEEKGFCKRADRPTIQQVRICGAVTKPSSTPLILCL